MKRYLVTILTVAALLTSCGTAIEEQQNNNQQTQPAAKAAAKASSKDASTEQHKADAESEVIVEEIFDDDNCRDDNDCSQTCMVCNNNHKCEYSKAGGHGKVCYGEHEQCNEDGICECKGNFEGDNCNTCKEGFTGQNCNECLPWHYGKECLPCSCIEGIGNTCDEGIHGTGACTCWDKGWGENCQHTSDCVNGTVDQNTGKCAKCNEGWSGEKCNIANDCQYGYGNFGINGNGKCQKCFNGGDIATNCETCIAPYTSENDGHCNACEAGWKMENGKCVEGCSVEGTKEIKADGTCVCYTPYSGKLCNQCSKRTDQYSGHWTMYEWGTGSGEGYPLNSCITRQVVVFEGSKSQNYHGLYDSEIEALIIQPLKKQSGDFIIVENSYIYTGYKWNDALNICPANWRMPTLEEAQTIVSNTPLQVSEYWTATSNENNNNEAYMLKYNKSTKRVSFETASKLEYKAIICITNI